MATERFVIRTTPFFEDMGDFPYIPFTRKQGFNVSRFYSGKEKL
jgi:hypothetical protein